MSDTECRYGTNGVNAVVILAKRDWSELSAAKVATAMKGRILPQLHHELLSSPWR